jgi:hypothetical protein
VEGEGGGEEERIGARREREEGEEGTRRDSEEGREV